MLMIETLVAKIRSSEEIGMSPRGNDYVINLLVEDRRRRFGNIPLCQACVHRCKVPNAQGLLKFSCANFKKKT